MKLRVLISTTKFNKISLLGSTVENIVTVLNL